MKKILLIITLCLCISSMTVTAANNTFNISVAENRYANTVRIKNSLAIKNSGKATIIVSVRGNQKVRKIKIRTRLMQYKNGTWSKHKSFSEINNDCFARIGVHYYVPKGYRYKLSSTFYLYDKDGKLIDFITEDSNEVYY